MPVLLSTYGLRGDIEPMVGHAGRVRALGTQFDMVAAATEGADARISTSVISRGAWL